MRIGIWLTMALLGGCFGRNGLGGDDLWGETGGPQVEGDMASTDGSAYVIAGHAWCSGATTPVLSAVGDAGEIWVLHEDFGGQCCESYDVTVEEDGSALNVSYDATSEGDCDCTCAGFTIEYVVGGVEAGDWTVNAGDQSDTVTVP
jgi:hypothetical protein